MVHTSLAKLESRALRSKRKREIHAMGSWGMPLLCMETHLRHELMYEVRKVS